MARAGRKPLGTAHVERLEGSTLAKRRLTWILQTMRGERTIPEACRALSICESRFHALRHQWLQEALDLLEPRPAGRPPKGAPPPEAEQLDALASENEQLRQRVMVAELREQLVRVMPHLVSETTTDEDERAQKKKRRRARRRKAR
jgi:hypothetical protein